MNIGDRLVTAMERIDLLTCLELETWFQAVINIAATLISGKMRLNRP
jgi:hypothetical protein